MLVFRYSLLLAQYITDVNGRSHVKESNVHGASVGGKFCYLHQVLGLQ